MRKLKEIIKMVQSGELPDLEELRYAIYAMEAINTSDSQALSELAQAELDGTKPVLTDNQMKIIDDCLEAHRVQIEG